MDKITRVSRIYRIILQIIFWYIPLQTIVFWVIYNHYDGYMRMPLPNIAFHELAPSRRVLGAVIDLMFRASVTMYGVNALIKLFKHFEQGKIFIYENFIYCRRIGYCIIIFTFTNIIYHSLMTLLLTIDNPPGQRMIGVTFGDVNIYWLVGGGMIILISWIMKEANRLHEDSRLTI